jgi:hypothetical protein
MRQWRFPFRSLLGRTLTPPPVSSSLARRAKRGASGRVKVPTWQGLTTHHYRVLRLWRSGSCGRELRLQANKRGEAYTGNVAGRMGTQSLRAGIASKSRSGLVSVVTCVKPKRAGRIGEPGESRRSSQATACNKRCVMNAGDPCRSWSETADRQDIQLLRHEWETRKQG